MASRAVLWGLGVAPKSNAAPECPGSSASARFGNWPAPHLRYSIPTTFGGHLTQLFRERITPICLFYTASKRVDGLVVGHACAYCKTVWQKTSCACRQDVVHMSFHPPLPDTCSNGNCIETLHVSHTVLSSEALLSRLYRLSIVRSRRKLFRD